MAGKAGGWALVLVSMTSACASTVEDAGASGDSPNDAPMAHPWPMLGQGPSHQGRNLTGSTTRGAHRSWELDLGEPLYGSCVIAADGTIYAATEHALRAVSPKGVEKWKAPIDFPNEESPAPAIGPHGDVYVRNGQGLAAFDREGKKAWDLAFPHGVLSSPTVAPDGTIYVSEPSGPLAAVSPSGAILETFVPGADGRYSTPVVRADGALTFMQVDTFGTEVWAFGPDGAPRFDVKNGGPVYGFQANPVEGPDGVTYLAPDEGLVALSSIGDVLWHAPSLSNNFGPAVAADGTIYPSYGAPLSALRPDGTPKWHYDAGWEGYGASAAIAADGTIYWAGDRLYMMSPEGELVRVIDVGSAIVSRLAIDDDGTALFGAADGKLYAR